MHLIIEYKERDITAQEASTQLIKLAFNDISLGKSLLSAAPSSSTIPRA
jgi:hypothetical protein